MIERIRIMVGRRLIITIRFNRLMLQIILKLRKMTSDLQLDLIGVRMTISTRSFQTGLDLVLCQKKNSAMNSQGIVSLAGLKVVKDLTNDVSLGKLLQGEEN